MHTIHSRSTQFILQASTPSASVISDSVNRFATSSSAYSNSMLAVCDEICYLEEWLVYSSFQNILHSAIEIIARIAQNLVAVYLMLDCSIAVTDVLGGNVNEEASNSIKFVAELIIKLHRWGKKYILMHVILLVIVWLLDRFSVENYISILLMMKFHMRINSISLLLCIMHKYVLGILHEIRCVFDVTDEMSLASCSKPSSSRHILCDPLSIENFFLFIQRIQQLFPSCLLHSNLISIFITNLYNNYLMEEASHWSFLLQYSSVCRGFYSWSLI